MAIAGSAANVVINVITKAETKKLDETAGTLDRLGSAAKRAAIPAAAVATAFVAGAKYVGDAASRQEQAMGAVDAVFGKSAGQVKAWGDQAAQTAGLSKSQYGEFASVMGAQLQSLGLSQGAAATSTDKMIRLGADLAAQFGGSSADAVSALGAAMRGEADPAERLGLSLGVTKVNAELAARGQDKLTGSALTAAKAQAVMDLATQQAAGANGAFAREANTAAGAQSIANASFADAAAQLGTAVLPAMVALAGILAGLAGFLSQNTGLVTALAVAAGALAGAVLLVNAGMKLAAAGTAVMTLATAGQAVATGTATTAQIVFNAATKALLGPIGLVIVAIGLAVAAVTYLWRNNETFRNVVTAAWRAVQSVALAVWNVIKSAVTAVIGVLKSVVGVYASVVSAYFRAVGAVAAAIWNALRAAGSAAFNAVKAVAGSALGGVRALLSGVGAIASSVWRALSSGASAAFNAVRAVASGVINGVRALLSGLGAIGSAVWSGISAGARVAGAVLAPVRSALEFVSGLVSRVIGAISSIRFPSPPAWLSGLFGRSAPAGFAASSAATFAATTSSSPAAARFGVASSPALPAMMARAAAAGAAGGDNVTIYALDGDSAARALARLQVRGTRRARGVALGAATAGLRA